MHQPVSAVEQLCQELRALDVTDRDYAPNAVKMLLAAACLSKASDLHLQPSAEGLVCRWRRDGVLCEVATLPKQLAPNVIARLKVMAELLTYRTDLPQEGRIPWSDGSVEMRLSTFPTLHGEKGVVRLFAQAGRYERLPDLGLPAEIGAQLDKLLRETSGVLLITGPAGSGKTTTVYACLRELIATTHGQRSLTSLEDPIEVEIAGVAQSQVHAAAGFDLATGLRFLLRQDPEVLLIGEVRDRAVAETVFQAALTGHLILTTFHAGSSVSAINRLSDMGIEPYLLRSGLLGIVSQRLVRQLCECKQPIDDAKALLGLPVAHAWAAGACDACGGSGYLGRMLLAELLTPHSTDVGRAILSQTETQVLERLAIEAGMVTCWDRALDAVQSGKTSPAEVRRVLGFAVG
jgi:type II secretory ATPase GspE/PulE/Tfp pilus assembly ATPase PilB-like protein